MSSAIFSVTPQQLHPGGADDGWSGTTRAAHSVGNVTLRYRLVVSGPLPHTTVATIHARFKPDHIVAGLNSTEVTGMAIDQPALRALAGLVWDTGGQILSFDTEPETTPSNSEGALE
jgi:hypothetical protein